MKMTAEGAGVVGSWVFLHSKNFDDEMANHRSAEQEVVLDCPLLVEPALSLIGPPYFVRGKDWDLDGSCPSLCHWTSQPVIDAASLSAVAEKPAVDELACWSVDSSP